MCYGYPPHCLSVSCSSVKLLRQQIALCQLAVYEHRAHVMNAHTCLKQKMAVTMMNPHLL